LCDALAFEPAIAPVLRYEDLHQIPAPIEEAPRAASAISHPALLRDGAFNRFGGEGPAQFRVTERAHALLIGQRHDLVPGRHAMEDALGIGDILVLGDIEAAPQIEDRAGDDRGAGTVAPRPGLERVLKPLQMLLPLVGLRDRLRDEIVDRWPS